MYGYQKSLTRGRELAEAAEQERQRLATAVNNMPIGLVMFDGDPALVGQIVPVQIHTAQPLALFGDMLPAVVSA